VSFQNIDVDDVTLGHICRRRLPSLLFDIRGISSLDLSGNTIGDGDMRLVATLPHLRQLKLDGAAVTAEGLCALRNKSSLVVLSLANSTIRDGDLGCLPDILVDDLDLSGTKITDSAIPHLAQMPSLLYVDISETGISAAGVRRLQEEASPELQIEHEGKLEHRVTD